MADHYLHAIERLDEVNDLRTRLRAEYLRDNHRREKIADLHSDIGRALKLAAIHADLAKVQQLEELNALLDERLSVPIARAAGL